MWRDGRVAREADAIVLAAVIAHDMGAPVIKVPVPAATPGQERQRAVARVVASVGVPVLFLGGPLGDAGREPVLEEVRDVMEGGGSGMAIGPRRVPGPGPGRNGRARRRVGPPMMILTIDFGTTVTKVGLWSDDGLVALTRAVVTTAHPQPGWAEQDPLRWWTSVVIACAESRAQAPAAFGRVDVIACSGARQTFVPVSPSGEPIGKGILWSDRRGVAEAPVLAEALGGEDINRARTRDPAGRRRHGGQVGVAACASTRPAGPQRRDPFAPRFRPAADDR